MSTGWDGHESQPDEIETCWAMMKDGQTSRCDLWPLRRGVQIRLSTDDEEHFICVERSRRGALAFADELRVRLTALGWVSLGAGVGVRLPEHVGVRHTGADS